MSNLSWIGDRCIDHDKWSVEEDSPQPRWRRTMNLSISCFITALIIVTAALLLVTMLIYNISIPLQIMDPGHRWSSLPPGRLCPGGLRPLPTDRVLLHVRECHPLLQPAGETRRPGLQSLPALPLSRHGLHWGLVPAPRSHQHCRHQPHSSRTLRPLQADHIKIVLRILRMLI